MTKIMNAHTSPVPDVPDSSGFNFKGVLGVPDVPDSSHNFLVLCRMCRILRTILTCTSVPDSFVLFQRCTGCAGLYRLSATRAHMHEGNAFLPAHPAHPLKTSNTRRRKMGKKMTVLTLDLGSKTGWALHGADQSITSGTVEFKNDRWQGGGMRFLRFKQWLTEIKQMAGDLNAVFVEEVRNHKGVDASHAYGGFLAHVTAWCEHHQIPYEAVPVGTIKRHATGKGNAGTEAVIAAMKQRGFNPADDNEADALAILGWAQDNRMGDVR